MKQNLFQNLNSQEILDNKYSSEIDNGNNLAIQNLTKISNIQPGMAGLNLLGRVVNLTDIKPHLVKGSKFYFLRFNFIIKFVIAMYGYYQSILIKDDTGLIAVKLYLREAIQINAIKHYILELYLTLLS
jgi:hypothetical protein